MCGDADRGMTLREFIDELSDIAKHEGNDIEVVAIAENGESYTPIIAIGPGKDGVRRVSVA